MSSHFLLWTPEVTPWDVPQCTGLPLFWLLSCLLSCCLLPDLSWMFSRSPACPPSHALRLTRDTSQYQTSNRHPPMVTHFSSDDRITSFSSFTLTSNRQSPK
ncbi:hypothetical protein GOODEAATRI_025502, partial [Goodea atripinnis]